eukprot:480449-Hanusia_phi.AAC.1
MSEGGGKRERTTTELELELERLEATNLNLKLRVSQVSSPIISDPSSSPPLDPPLLFLHPSFLPSSSSTPCPSCFSSLYSSSFLPALLMMYFIFIFFLLLVPPLPLFLPAASLTISPYPHLICCWLLVGFPDSPQAGGSPGGGDRQGTELAVCHPREELARLSLPEDGDQLRVRAREVVRITWEGQAIESEWVKVQRLHEEVFQLRAELELGKLPSEVLVNSPCSADHRDSPMLVVRPSCSRCATCRRGVLVLVVAEVTAWQERNGALEGEVHVARSNAKEVRGDEGLLE